SIQTPRHSNARSTKSSWAPEIGNSWARKYGRDELDTPDRAPCRLSAPCQGDTRNDLISGKITPTGALHAIRNRHNLLQSLRPLSTTQHTWDNNSRSVTMRCE